MNTKQNFTFKLLTLLIVFTCFVFSLMAQTPPDDKPKTKDFGSSLKKDAKSVENEDDEVLRVETKLVVQDILVFFCL